MKSVSKCVLSILFMVGATIISVNGLEGLVVDNYNSISLIDSSKSQMSMNSSIIGGIKLLVWLAYILAMANGVKVFVQALRDLLSELGLSLYN